MCSAAAATARPYAGCTLPADLALTQRRGPGTQTAGGGRLGQTASGRAVLLSGPAGLLNGLVGGHNITSERTSDQLNGHANIVSMGHPGDTLQFGRA
jgi:hypothetical protein